MHRPLLHGLLERGIYLPASGYELCFVLTADTANEFEQLVTVVHEVASEHPDQ